MNLQATEQYQLLQAILRRDFKSFVVKVFNEVSSSNQFMDNWHIDVICNELMKVVNGDGEPNRLIINISPRHLKSIICSVALPAFILGHNPKAEMICVSYSDELASKFAFECRRIIECLWYKDLFPATRLAKDKKAISDFSTTRGGGRYATSVCGTLTGRGADLIIIDDPIKPMDSMSNTMREKTNDWYGHTLISRLNNKNTGKIIVIMQRLHDEDFTGYLLDNDPAFELVKIQAIAEEDEEWIIQNPINNRGITIIRQAGEALHPAREGIVRLQEIRNSMGEFNFAGQYQQNPMPREGGVIKKEWLQFYNPEELAEALKFGVIRPSYVLQSWDTANKVEEHNDYSVCLTLLRDQDKKLYVLDCHRTKLEFPSLIKKVAEKHNAAKEKYKCPIKVLIEDHGSGTQLIQTLKNEHRIYPEAVKPEYDKATRLQAVSHLIENGTCLFPNNTPHWWRDFETELLRFPRAKHDDQCDALSQALGHQPKGRPRVWRV